MEKQLLVAITVAQKAHPQRGQVVPGDRAEPLERRRRRKPVLALVQLRVGRAEYRRRDEEIDSYTEIAVSPEDDVEVRRITLTNLSSSRRNIELTSYAEVVLATLLGVNSDGGIIGLVFNSVYEDATESVY